MAAASTSALSDGQPQLYSGPSPNTGPHLDSMLTAMGPIVSPIAEPNFGGAYNPSAFVCQELLRRIRGLLEHGPVRKRSPEGEELQRHVRHCKTVSHSPAQSRTIHCLEKGLPPGIQPGVGVNTNARGTAGVSGGFWPRSALR